MLCVAMHTFVLYQCLESKWLTESQGTHTRATSSREIRHIWKLSSDFPRIDLNGRDVTSGRLVAGF